MLAIKPTFKNNKTYFGDLKAYMNRNDVIRAWYDYLMSFLDVEDYDFCANRPHIKIYNDINEACLPNTTKYLDYLINEYLVKYKVVKDGIYPVKASAFFENYVKWKQETNHKDDNNSTTFGSAMTNKPGITKEMKSEGYTYNVILYQK